MKTQKAPTITKAQAWIDLVSMAASRPTPNLKVGQILAPGSLLEARWSWSRKTVLCFLDLLARNGLITRVSSERQGRIIEITNYTKEAVDPSETAQLFEPHPMQKPHHYRLKTREGV